MSPHRKPLFDHTTPSTLKHLYNNALCAPLFRNVPQVLESRATCSPTIDAIASPGVHVGRHNSKWRLTYQDCSLKVDVFTSRCPDSWPLDNITSSTRFYFSLTNQRNHLRLQGLAPSATNSIRKVDKFTSRWSDCASTPQCKSRDLTTATEARNLLIINIHEPGFTFIRPYGM